MPPASATFFLHRERSYPPGQVQADDVCDDDDGRVDVAEYEKTACRMLMHDDVYLPGSRRGHRAPMECTVRGCQVIRQ